MFMRTKTEVELNQAKKNIQLNSSDVVLSYLCCSRTNLVWI